MRRFPRPLGLALALIVASWATVRAEPEARPAADGASGSLARYVPRENLVGYVEFDGLDAHADAWRRTAAYKLLNQTTAGAMLEAVFTQLADAALDFDSAGDKKVLTGAEALSLLEHAFRAGFVFGVNQAPDQPKPSGAVLVLRGAARGETQKLFARFLEDGPNGKPRGGSVIRARGRVINVVGPQQSGFAWWAEKNDLVFTLPQPESGEAILDALDGKKPSASDHPIRAEMSKVNDGFQPVGLAFLDATHLPKLPPKLIKLGLDGLKRVDFRWGFQGDALMSVTRIEAPAPRKGILALLDQPTFEGKDLPPRPANITGFTAFAIDPDKLFDQLTNLAKTLEPKSAVQIDQVVKIVQDQTGLRLREDILGHLGPRMAYYTVPTRINAPTNALSGFVRGLLQVPQTTLIVEVDDAEAFSKTLDQLVVKANEAFKSPNALMPKAFDVQSAPVEVPVLPGEAEEVKKTEETPEEASQPKDLPEKKAEDVKKPDAAEPEDDEAKPAEVKGPVAEFRKLPAPERGYVLALPPGVAPMPAGMRPTVLIGKKYIVISSTPKAARAALALESKRDGLWAPAGSLARSFETMPKGLMFLNVSDPSESLMPELIANLPNIVQTIGSYATLRMARPGVPGQPDINVGFHLRVDSDEIPLVEDMEKFLFPATSAVSVDDRGLTIVIRESFPGFNPVSLAPIGLALTLPAVQSARSAAQRSQSTNNLKQIGLAMHNYLSTNESFPPPAITDADGKPLLSWRVAILPFIEQQELFNEFHLDEPWDSEHNKALLERMPSTYAIPSEKPTEPGMTFYEVFTGNGALFDPKEKTSIASVTDGTSNTIMAVEAKEAVPWTKPDDLPFDPEKPLPKLGGHFEGGFNALFADGSVRFIRESIAEMTLRALITRAGGEVVSSDQF